MQKSLSPAIKYTACYRKIFLIKNQNTIFLNTQRTLKVNELPKWSLIEKISRFGTLKDPLQYAFCVHRFAKVGEKFPKRQIKPTNLFTMNFLASKAKVMRDQIPEISC